MSERSVFILGEYVFIKIVSLNESQGESVQQSLQNGETIPFESIEFLFSYLISKSGEILRNVPRSTLITPGTQVFVSMQSYTVQNFSHLKDFSYQNVAGELQKNFIPFDRYSTGIIRTAVIISEKMTGSYEHFLGTYRLSKEYDKLVTDSLTHIAYLLHVLQNKYQGIHGDPKIQNYTWLKLDKPIDIEYDFRDQYNSDPSRIIVRKGVEHLFYLTDLEFAWSPVVKFDNRFRYNFKHNNYWYSNEGEKIYVPKISNQDYYQLNFNLYGGYNVGTKQDMDAWRMQVSNIYELYGDKFPRMFTIDILTLIKMFLTYWYAGRFGGDLSRRLNIYFTKFVAISNMEKDPYRRDTGDYRDLSVSSFATLLNM